MAAVLARGPSSNLVISVAVTGVNFAPALRLLGSGDCSCTAQLQVRVAVSKRLSRDDLKAQSPSERWDGDCALSQG
jgi:hypothetical protein